jgi:hypothetical protein
MSATRLSLATVTLLMTAACAKKAAMLPPAPLYPEFRAGDPSSLQESLFKGDQEVLSNQDIERILASHVDLSNHHRLVVLALSPPSSWYLETSVLDEQNADRFLKTVATAPQLTEVRMMPALLVPEKRTVSYLREAAARFQADLLLVYTSRVRNFQRDRLLGAGEVSAECAAESVLLDVRTGIVVDSARKAESVTVHKSAGDLNFAQTVAKSESIVAGVAMAQLAGAVVLYLRDAK